MENLIKKLTTEQALEVVKRLTEKGGEIRDAVLTEARNLLTKIDLDETADEVFFVLDSIDVQDCWKILLKNLRSSFENLRTNGGALEMIGDFPFMLSQVEAFFGFFSRILEQVRPFPEWLHLAR